MDAPHKALTARDLMHKLALSREAVEDGAVAANPINQPVSPGGSTPGVVGFQPGTAPRKRSIASEFGFNMFTSGIRLGWQTELCSRKFRQAVLAEFVGMALFVAVGSAAAIFTFPDNASDNPFAPYALTARSVLVPLTFGLMITVMVFAIGDISGCNLNPAVTAALFVSRKMSSLRALAYVCAQVAGATAGSAYVYSLDPAKFTLAAVSGAANIVAPAADGSLLLWRAVGGEALGAALLVFTVCAAADVGRETHTKYVGAMTPLAIGFAVLLAHVFLVPIDGCSINPARSFGSAAVMGQWGHHWVFWVGPLAGSLTAAMCWEWIFKGPGGSASSAASGSGAASGPGYTGVGRGLSFTDAPPVILEQGPPLPPATPLMLVDRNTANAAAAAGSGSGAVSTTSALQGATGTGRASITYRPAVQATPRGDGDIEIPGSISVGAAAPAAAAPTGPGRDWR